MTVTDNEGCFPTSGCPRYLEWYECYDDPARRVWVDGMELKNNKEVWEEKQRHKWNFFYRPIRAVIGRPQKRQIREREQKVCREQWYLERLKRLLVRDLVLCVIGLLVGGWLWEYLMLIPLAIGAARAGQFTLQKRKSSERIDEWRAEIDQLHAEIQQLYQQIPGFPSSEQVEEWLSQEIKALERKCLAEIVNLRTDDPRLFDTIRHQPIEAQNNPHDLHGLLIEGWGPLQPPTIKGPFGEERTGLHRITKELGFSAGTWRRGTSGQPIYRVMYLQYIFLLEKNINVYGFFYDFVTRKCYGKRTETFQYNHVTNYSIREVELDEGEGIRQLDVPEEFRRDLLDREINAFSMAVSSGAYFRCVLSDDSVVDAINGWLKADEECQARSFRPEPIQFEPDERGRTAREQEEERKQLQRLEEEWTGEDRKEHERVVLELLEQRRALEEQDIHLARRALQQVREEVENYVQRVQETSLRSASLTGG